MDDLSVLIKHRRCTTRNTPMTGLGVVVCKCGVDYYNEHIERYKVRFFTVSSLRHELPPTRTLKWPGFSRVQITCNTSGTHHMHMCHVVRRDGSAIKFDKVWIAYLWVLFLLAETINQWKRGGNHSTLRKPLAMNFRKCRILKQKNSSPSQDRTHTLALMTG